MAFIVASILFISFLNILVWCWVKDSPQKEKAKLSRMQSNVVIQSAVVMVYQGIMVY
jgi:hypothetical protein